MDCRRLNTVTKKDVYPLPRIDDAIDCLHSASYFSSIDLRSGYWQIPMNPQDKEKTAFVTLDGLFEFSVMPFGLCNAPATFERFMDTIFRGLRWEICMCYLDDVVIYGKTFHEHNQRLEVILDCLQHVGLILILSAISANAKHLSWDFLLTKKAFCQTPRSLPRSVISSHRKL